ncbi:MAG TPA: hypothetical protein VLE96_02285 [Chlamydiales bacterium]|nr:hypothetical protein [Chlamydiales bacterium]
MVTFHSWNSLPDIMHADLKPNDNSLRNKIIDILNQTPGDKLSEELTKEQLTTEIVLTQLTDELKNGNRSLAPSVLGKALSLITDWQQPPVEDCKQKFMYAVLDYSSTKDEFVATIEQCILLNEKIAVQALEFVLHGYTKIKGLGPEDLKRIRDAREKQGASLDGLQKFIFTEIQIRIKKKNEDAAINFINQFPEFANRDVKNDEGKPLVLLAIKEQCAKVVDHLIQINRGNNFASDRFGANIVDYAIAYEMDDKCRNLDQLFSILFSEIREAKWLAQIWNLDGIVRYEDVSSNCDGFEGKDGVPRIAHSAISYLKHWKKYRSEKADASHPLKKMDTDLMRSTLAALSVENSRSITLTLKTPAFVKTEWEKHAACAFFGRKNRVMKCNRGAECGVPGVRMYMSWEDITAQKVVQDKLRKVNKYMNSSDFDQELRLRHVVDFVQKEQPMGNCVSESGKAAVYAMFIDEALQAFPDGTQALNHAKAVYKDCTVFMKMKALEDYLKSSEHYDINLLNRIKEKTLDLEKRKDLWKGKSAEVLSLFKKNNITGI